MTKVIDNISDLRNFLKLTKKPGSSVGFFPTMGALHKGHIDIAIKCKKENDISVVSIFVNPTQFNDKKDLEKYPRDINADLLKIIPAGLDVLFNPPYDEIYPDGAEKDNDIFLGGLDTYMEGEFRPGHFRGVAQVVKRLLEIVQPDKLYMGQKDFQQYTIIQYMIDSYKLSTKLIVCPIVRESNGLAMSSRNEQLSPQTREKAGIIYKTLKSIKKNQNIKSIHELLSFGMKKLTTPVFKPEYLSIVDGKRLTQISDINESDYAVVCVAVWADGVRLIDNVILKGGQE